MPDDDNAVADSISGVPTDRTILTVITADSGWRAIYGGQEGEESSLSRIVAWALTEDVAGSRCLVGLVVDPQDRTKIVPATGTESPHAGKHTGYGYKEN